ncbi:hypothetical protein, partial [Actinoplanes rectilineatus]|uniref:hypothetical protein n=1 Tax=Actinoplanes rectilineatus TaxID=113571 RepID=UPI0005F2D362
PEPNTFVRVDNSSLETDITFGVRNDPQGDLKYTSKEGRGLAQSVAQQRLFQGMDPLAFGAFDPSVSIETQADRLLQNYDPANPDAIPQSHADRETWKKQVQNYIQTFYPGIDANKANGLTQLAFKSVEPISPTTQKNILNDFKGDLGNGAKTLIQVAGATHSALSSNPHTTSQAPPDATPVATPIDTRVDVPTDSTPDRPQGPDTSSKAWQDAYDNAEQKQLRTERYNPSKDTIVPGTHLLRGEITTIDFTSRDFTVDGKDYRSFEVKLDLTSRDDQMTPEQLRDFANDIQNTIDQMVNGQHTLPGGRELHVQLDVETKPWSESATTDDWQDTPGSRPPVEITSAPLPDPDNPDDHTNDGNTTNQSRWNTNNNPAVMVHEVMHYLGVNEGYRADHHLFNTQDRPGVMGPEVHNLPATSADITNDVPSQYLHDKDLQFIQNVSDTAGPVRQTATPTGDTTTSTTADTTGTTGTTDTDTDTDTRNDAHTDSAAPRTPAPTTQSMQDVLTDPDSGRPKGSRSFQNAVRTYDLRQVGTPVTVGQLGPRNPETADKPAYLATVPVTPHDDIQNLITAYAQGFRPGTSDGRFGLVIGVNGFGRSFSDTTIQNAVNQVRNANPPFPVTVIGFSWNNSRIGPNDSPGQDTIPYAA